MLSLTRVVATLTKQNHHTEVCCNYHRNIVQFNFFDSDYLAKIDFQYIDGQYMVSLSVNGWLQSVGIVDNMPDFLEWLSQAEKNFEVK